MKRLISELTGMCLGCCLLASCVDAEPLEKSLSSIEARLDLLFEKASIANDNAAAVKALYSGKVLIVDFVETETGYTLELSDGSVVKVVFGEKITGVVPIIGLDESGRWIMSVDGGNTFTEVEGATPVSDTDGITPMVKVDDEGFWLVSIDNGQTWARLTNDNGIPVSAVNGASVAGKASVFEAVLYDATRQVMTFIFLNGKKIEVPVLDRFYLKVIGWKDGTEIRSGWEVRYEIELAGVENTMITAPDGWIVKLTDTEINVVAPQITEDGPAEIAILLVSKEGYLKTVKMTFNASSNMSVITGCKIWDDFANKTSENILLDYSYAGYNHGETEPGDVWTLGYKVYDITDYGAVPDDRISDRDAFLSVLSAILGGADQVSSARAIIYFPEGEFILHTAADNVNGQSQAIQIRCGDIILKGAGRDKTTIVMQDPNLPASSALYSSPEMIEFKHWSGLSEIAQVNNSAAKGSFSVECSSVNGMSEGDFVCLVVENNSPDFIAKELSPYSVEQGMTDILNNGIRVYDYHQIKSIEGKTVTFEEPIMHEVETGCGWKMCKYPHYENIGVEDITFKGYAKPDFVHHGSWQDDGAYKPVAFTRVANSWMRRCRFTSVSEAFTVTNSANVSVYDILIDGNRGHSAVRSQGSSRVFIGAVTEVSGYGAGQYHASGVAKPSLGTVLWRNHWGNNSCFESHATQPRATLIDCCVGGWMQSRQGGDAAQVPNHLNDLTIWNMESTTPYSGTWNWYDINGIYWKFVMPIMVGFHGELCVINPAQCTVDYSHGTAVNPESLYEEQLRLRLGYVPSWLNSLK